MGNTSTAYAEPNDDIYGFVPVEIFFVIGPHTFVSFYDGLDFILR